jgi:spectinomycin phosphotransferase
MLEKPDISDEKVTACLRGEFGCLVTDLEFLPIGADLNSVVYRAFTTDKQAFFVKLRRADFNPVMAALPSYLSRQGIKQIIPPLETTSGLLWATLDEYSVLLYPFILGSNCFDVELTTRQWADLGTALKRIHSTELPAELCRMIPVESFSPRWRAAVRNILTEIEADRIQSSARLAVLLNQVRVVIQDLVERTERLAKRLALNDLEFVVCHSDIHAGNIFVSENGDLYIVDWDNPILAPKERDLMFFGNSQGYINQSPQSEEELFYRGYGDAKIYQDVLAYYRYERIIEDIAAFFEQLISTEEGGQDWENSFNYLKSNFSPGNTIAMAYRSDKSSGAV